jgi:hypothetical protein
MTAGLGVVADARGLETALVAVAALGVVSFVLAALLPRDRTV